MPLTALVRALDAKLELSRFEDVSHNGLQVARSDKPIRAIACGVDASLPFFEAAAARGADLLICHHGLSWGDSLKRITGLNYRQLAFLIEHDMALWACHLPLDAHARLGNNAVLARALGLRAIKPFGDYHGMTIGWSGTLPRAVQRESFQQRLADILRTEIRVMPFGHAAIRAVGIVSGGAAEMADQAAAAGLDAFVSGEATLQGFNLAQQHAVNAFFGGHYATERFGVESVGRWIRDTFGIPADFIDLRLAY